MAEGRCRLREGRGREKGKENILREKNGGRSAKRSVFIEAALQNLKKKIFSEVRRGGKLKGEGERKWLAPTKQLYTKKK